MVNKIFIEQANSEPKVKVLIPMYEPLEVSKCARDTRTFRVIQQTYNRINQLRFPSNLPDVNEKKYKEAIETIDRTERMLS